MKLSPKQKHWLIWGGVYLFVFLIALWLWSGRAGAPKWSWLPQATDQPASQEAAPASFDKNLHAIDDPASLWFIVNKQRPVPPGYAPTSLRQPAVRVRSSGSSEMLLRADAATALERLVAGAAQQGINLMLVSGYRSYGLQQAVYAGNVAREGQANADKTSARPGHSEHQTGLAADVGAASGTCQLEACFGQTPEGKWLAAHAAQYGFVIRYPNNMQSVVGYTYEPWHLRYVGPELAAEISKTGQVLEQFFGLPAAPNY